MTRLSLSLIAALILPLLAPAHARAQTYPAKPIRIIVALAPGGGVDSTARIVGQKLAQLWGQQVVIENRPGAGGTIAAETVARTAPDGYTLLMTSSSFAMTPSLYKLSYDVSDFAPVTVVVVAPNVLVVHPSVPARSVKDLIAIAKARPGDLLFSSSGNGSPGHFVVELLKLTNGAKMVHVPYKGTAPSMIDLVAGRVSASAASVTSTMPHVRAGRLRALAVIGAKRSISVPELPTVAEAGVPGFAIDVWYALLAPAGTAKPIVARLAEETSRIVAQQGVKERMLAGGLEPLANTPEEFTDYLRAEVTKWSKVIREAGVRID